jgi:hypothetical protein
MAGRPATGRQKQIAVSLGEEQRAELEAAAAQAGRGVAEEVRARLNRTFDEDRLDEGVREFADEIRKLAQNVVAQRGPLTSHKVYKALAAGIELWLELIQPPQPILPEPDLMGSDDPATVGRTIALTLYRTPGSKRQRQADERVRAIMFGLYQGNKPKPEDKS